jgi:hypothetical protein
VTVSDWLRDRQPVPPTRLAARIESAVGMERGHLVEAAAFYACLESCESLLGDLAARSAPGREAALDLLAADALATYALEAAADDPTTLETRAREAMKRLAAIAGE